MYTSATVLHVRVVMKAVGPMTCDVDAWVVVRGAVMVVLEWHGTRFSKLAHVANREGGPSHQSLIRVSVTLSQECFLTKSGLGSRRITRPA